MLLCSKCHRKLQHGFSSFQCPPCNEENTVGVAVSQDLQDWDLPQCVHEIAGSTLTFQLSLSHFNISAIHQIFTVSRIFYYNQCPPQLNFEGHVSNKCSSLCNFTWSLITD
ncbi:unnamed protein product [Brassica rapa subsp. trilocularis]